ncbi:chalcone isomerase family protein [Inhella gelatinilytica]|uniref:Chalcone isomerase family protein n=1 Tax=Inhella gelatinilytica TaxID=2795030 RepID=A0A931J018_9BURK|nr:chalcone isomerase family protein [Inhella gelatinilytica]MBH9554279.1 chalcone isomerase family protein [Inhella gelatinilytica]
MEFRIARRTALATAVALVCAPSWANPLQIAGVNVEPTAKVAGKELKLNGAGIRTRVIVKVYVMALYLTEKQTTSEGVYDSQGPRRFTLTMLREVNGDDFGQAFMAGITANTTAAERSKYVNQLTAFGEAFVNVGTMNKGGVLTADWVPGTGMVMAINGKPFGDVLPDLGFYNAVLKIWLGDKPVDKDLKPGLLGALPK